MQQGEGYVCLNAHMANDIVHFWLQQGILAAFADVTQIMREKTYGKSRFDFLLQRGGKRCYAEVKSVNLLDGDTARFPDAPTARGSKHLQELMQCKQDGLDSAVIFLVMGNRPASLPSTGTQIPRSAAAAAGPTSRGRNLYIHLPD